MSSAARTAWLLTICGYLGVLALMLAWYAWLAPLPSVPVVMSLLAFAGLLLLPLRGILHGRRYTVAWSLFLCIAYFTHGVVEAWSNADVRRLAYAEIALTLLWFSAGITYIRLSRPPPGTHP